MINIRIAIENRIIDLELGYMFSKPTHTHSIKLMNELFKN